MMIRRILPSIIIAVILLLPQGVFAASKIIVPTSIQVVGKDGETSFEKAPQTQEQEEQPAPFLVGKECLPFMDTAPSAVEPTPAHHSPVATRIESQRATLASLSEHLTFAPHLPPLLEKHLKEHLVSNRVITSTSTSITLCLKVLNAETRARGGMDQQQLIFDIDTLLQGLRYGARIDLTLNVPPPTTEREALYAGDFLLTQHPSIQSISITKDHAVIRIPLPVRILGLWAKEVVATITCQGNTSPTVNIVLPWWATLNKNSLAKIAPQYTTIKAEVADMYSCAQSVVEHL